MIVGTSVDLEGEPRPVRWTTSGSEFEIEVLADVVGHAAAVSDSGQVVGWANSDSGNDHAYLWDSAGATDLGTLGGSESHAHDINESGVIVGWSETATGEQHAFVWVDGNMVDLGALGGESSAALGINDSGLIVGWAQNEAQEYFAVVWTQEPENWTLEATSTALSMTITTQDIYFDPDILEIPANTPVEVVIVNEGAAPHNFSVDALDISIDVAPGETESVVIEAPTGEYQSDCNVPGHREAGMVGTLT